MFISVCVDKYNVTRQIGGPWVLHHVMLLCWGGMGWGGGSDGVGWMAGAVGWGEGERVRLLGTMTIERQLVSA